MVEGATGRRTRGRGSRAIGTRRRILEAATQTLKREGFAGTSARAIAAAGGFNQALVFYHFGSVNELLLAVLDETSAKRMQRYRDTVARATTLPELAAAAAGIYREDLDSGHIQVLVEMIAGASAHPELGPQIVARIEPWIELVRETAERVGTGLPLVPAEDVAFAVVALYLGVELLTHLQRDPGRADRLFRAGIGLTGVLDGLFGPVEPRNR